MLDINFIRQNPQKVKEAAFKKGVDVGIDRLLEEDKKRREALTALEQMRAQKNKASKAIAEIKNEAERKKLILEMRELDTNSDRLTKALKESEQQFRELLLQIPNMPFDDVPEGKDESGNKVLYEAGKKPKFSFAPKAHYQIGEELDIIDIKRAAKTSGTRFGFLKGEAVLLELALVNFAFDVLRKEKFISVLPPVMLKEEMAKATGYFEATDRDEAYFLPKDNLFLAGTSEQPLIAMHEGEVFSEKELPLRYAAFSTCFRRESGSYGKDTKGILRVHQFDKVEMVSFCKPEDSKKEHQCLLKIQEKLMQSLKMPYRVVQMCTGDLGRPAAAKYDIESWLPSENRYRETHSVSNCTDFQARRLNIRYRDKTGKLNFVHTVNGTAFAIGRIIIMLIENYQQKDGGVLIPAALKKYTKFKKISAK